MAWRVSSSAGDTVTVYSGKATVWRTAGHPTCYSCPPRPLILVTTLWICISISISSCICICIQPIPTTANWIVPFTRSKGKRGSQQSGATVSDIECWGLDSIYSPSTAGYPFTERNLKRPSLPQTLIQSSFAPKVFSLWLSLFSSDNDETVRWRGLGSEYCRIHRPADKRLNCGLVISRF